MHCACPNWRSAALQAAHLSYDALRMPKLEVCCSTSSSTVLWCTAHARTWSPLLYKQLNCSVMHCACPIWRSAARTHVHKLHVLQPKCLRIATNAPWYVTNRQIHEYLEIPFFAGHIRSLTENFDLTLASAGNPLVRQLGRHLCQPGADWSYLHATDEDWRSADQSRLPRKWRPSWRNA
jgi:hypothetical protein